MLLSSRIALVVLAYSFVFLFHSVVYAQPELLYDAPEECPDRETVEGALEEAVEPVSEEEDERTISFYIVRVPESQQPYVIEITLNGSDVGGARRLSAQQCSTLLDAAVVVVALALGPRADFDVEQTYISDNEPPIEAPNDPIHVDQEPQETITQTEEHALPRPVAPQHPRVHLGAWFEPIITVGASPSFTGGLSLGLTLALSHFQSEIGFQVLPYTRGYIDGNDGAGASFSFFIGEIRFCGRVDFDPLSFSLCGGAELGGVLAKGFAVDIEQTNSVIWIAPEARAVLLYRVGRTGRISLRFDLSVYVPSYRTTFYIEGLGDVYRPSPIGGKFGFGFFMNFF